MYAFSVLGGGVTSVRVFQMKANNGEKKSSIRPAKLSEVNIEHRAGVIGGLPLFLALGAVHQLRKFTHSSQRHAMVREIEKELLQDTPECSTSELMKKMTKLVTLEIDELQLLLETAQKDAHRAKLEVEVLDSELQAAHQLIRNWEDRGYSEMARTAKRLFSILGSNEIRAARAEREILTLREEVSRLRTQKDEAKADIVKICAVWSMLVLALGKFLANGSGDLANLFYR